MKLQFPVHWGMCEEGGGVGGGAGGGGQTKNFSI